MAGMALLGGSMANAESILLHNGMVYQAISINLQMHNWNRYLNLLVLIITTNFTHPIFLQSFRISTKTQNARRYCVVQEAEIFEHIGERRNKQEVSQSKRFCKFDNYFIGCVKMQLLFLQVAIDEEIVKQKIETEVQKHGNL